MESEGGPFGAGSGAAEMLPFVAWDFLFVEEVAAAAAAASLLALMSRRIDSSSASFAAAVLCLPILEAKESKVE